MRMMTYQDYEKEKREFLAFVNSLPHCEVFNKNQGVYEGEKLKLFEGVYEEVAKFQKIRGHTLKLGVYNFLKQGVY